MMQQALDIAHLQLSFIMTVPSSSTGPNQSSLPMQRLVSQILSRLQRQNEFTICSMNGQPSQLGLGVFRADGPFRPSTSSQRLKCAARSPILTLNGLVVQSLASCG